MAEVKVRIVANANDAINALQKLDRQVGTTAKEFSKLQTEDGGISNRNFIKVTKNIVTYANYLKQLNPGLEGQKKATQYVDKAYGDLYKTLKLTESQQKVMYNWINKERDAYNQTAISVKKLADAHKKTVNPVAEFGKKLVEITKNIMGFQLVIAIIRKGLTAIENFFTDSTKLAAEAEQTYSKLSTVYEGFAETATQASEALAKSIGVSQSTATGAMSTVGDLLQAQGMGVAESLETATKWVEQFQDIIAFKDINMSLEEFSQNFMSGAAGNLRNFRTFGSIVKESAVQSRLASKGLDKLAGSELELAKMTARAEIALEQQANAIGATGREWNTVLSINRRLEEAQKKLKENVGEEINQTMKPLKSWWTDVLEQINADIAAKKEYLRITGNTPKETETADNRTTGQKAFADRIRMSIEGFDQDASLIMRGNGQKYLWNTIQSYGISVDQAIEVLNENKNTQKYVNDALIEYLKEQEAHLLSIKKAREIQDQVNAKQQQVANTYGAFLENLRGIAGVSNSTGLDIIAGSGDISARGQALMQTAVQSNSLSAVDSAIDQLTHATAETFGKELEDKIGEFGKKELYQAQIESLKSAYSVAMNEFIKTGEGIDGSEQTRLSAIIDEIVTLKGQLEELNQTIEDLDLSPETARKNLNSTMNATAAFYGKTLESSVGNYGLVDLLRDQMADLVKQYTANYANFTSIGSQNGEYISNDEAQVLKDTVNQYKILNQKLKEAEDAQQALTDAQEKAKELEEQRKEFLESLNPFQEQFTAYSNGQAMFGEALGGGLNSGTGVYSEGAGGVLAGILGVVIDILKRTEVFSKLTSFVDDYIVPVFDAVLRPLLPAIEVIGQVVQDIFEVVLRPLFPVFKIIAEAVVIIMTPIKIVAAVIKNVYIAVSNIWQRLTHPITGGNQQSYVSVSDVWEEQVELLKKIHDMTFEIEKNTEDDDDKLSAYYEMYSKGMINASEYASLVNGLSGIRNDKLQSWENGTYYNGENGTTIVYSGGISFTVNGTNMSSEEIFQAFQDWLAKQQRGGAQLTA